MIDTSKIKPGDVIHCPEEWMAKELCEAMGWDAVNDSAYGPYRWKDFGSYTCYRYFDNEPWERGSYGHYVGYGCTPIEFTDLPRKQSRLAEMLGVDEKQEFYLGDRRHCKWRINHGVLESQMHSGANWTESNISANGLFGDKIHPIPKYSPETIKDAKAAKRLYGSLMVFVEKAEDGQPSIKDIRGKYWPVGFNCFSDIQPGQCVALEEIVNAGNFI